MKTTYMIDADKEYNTIYQAYQDSSFIECLVIKFHGRGGASVIYRPSRTKTKPVINVFPKHMSNKEIDFFVNRGFAIKVHHPLRCSKYQKRKMIASKNKKDL